MTRRRDIEKHYRSLVEIRDIMNSMKNLSYMETRKISGFLDVQHEMVKHIETVAADFLGYYPDTLTATIAMPVDVYLLIGSERGFCGDFNHVLLKYYEAIPGLDDVDKLLLTAVGYKLEAIMEGDVREVIFIDGASVADEVDEVLNRIVDQLASIQEQYGSLNLFVIHHDDERHIVKRQVLPPFQNLLQLKPGEAYAPELNLVPRKFLLDLGYHYMFLVLNEILYTSLLAESRQRVDHLESSVDRMDEQSEMLRRKSNQLRQEEIIEEIEVILLSAVSLDEPSLHGRPKEN